MTQAQARDEILTFFKVAWEADAESVNVPIYYWDVKKDGPTQGSPFARITVRHLNGVQATLADQVGNRKFERNGVITVQVFTPFGGGLVKNDALAKVASDAFEGKATQNQIWFRDVTINEIGQDEAWFQTNVTANFTYDEQK